MKLVLVIEEVHKIMKMKKIQLMKKQILVIKKIAPDDGNEEDTIAEEANSGDGRSALDDENEEEICDEKAKSGT